MIGIVDYGAGNLRSVTNAMDALNAQFQIIRAPEAIVTASKLILPGVGHFGQMMRSLDAMNVRGPLIDRIQAGVPFLGVCLGMQALFESSAEAPDARGLGIFPGRVQRFPETNRVPHMGWNQVQANPRSRLFQGFSRDPWFYFAHSYYVPATGVTSGECQYSVTYSAAVEYQNIFGVQFHPEKSAAAGHLLLRRFLEM
jgi:imidazole glycerol phosphate synthase glutamine amidotransferase subunit